MGVLMGRYVNPGNDGFSQIVQSDYVDKTDLVHVFDSTVETMDKLVMVSRPRRFGKSFAAQSLAAFYSCGCDSRGLFQDCAVARHEGWDRHLNAYNVIVLDMTEVIQESGVEDVVGGISRMLLPELRAITSGAGDAAANEGGVLKSAIIDVVRATGRKFVFVIDEWDAPYRLARNNKVAQDTYAEWLRGLFKSNTFTPVAVAGAYMTGILPIKKYNHQSAVSDFQEYTMVDPADYAPYVGFLQEDVELLSERFGMDMADLRRWYDGYALRNKDASFSVYAPYSLMRACKRGRTGTYWPSTETFELLRDYIEMDFDGLQTDLVRAIGGKSVPVDPSHFQNDMTSIESRDDVLTLLIHLGYLTYDEQSGMARVPNEEVRGELARTVRGSRHPKLAEMMRDSVRLLDDIVSMREQEVGEALRRVHNRDCTPLFYNNEQALRAVVKSALVAAIDSYARVEELPGGRGLADIVYLPKHGSQMPALLVELKWNKPVDAAIDQIHKRGYPAPLRDLDVPILLVGVTYDPKTDEHICHIEVDGEG